MKVLDDTPAVRLEDLKNVKLSANEILQLCCQVDVQLLGRNELQEKLLETVKTVPVKDCIPLAKQILQYITLNVLKMEEVRFYKYA